MTITRRTFLETGAALAAGAALVRCLPDVDGEWKSEGKELCTATDPRVAPGDPANAGRLVEIFDDKLTSGPKVDVAAAAVALQKLLLALTGKADLKAAWTALLPAVTATQIVGLKVNTLNTQVPTHPELVRAIVDSLKTDLGLSGQQIVVWDRRVDELTKAGFTADSMGCVVEGTQDTAQAKGAGRGYELKPICIGGRNTHLSNILTRRLDHLINVAVVKRHDASGFTGCLKNHYGSIDNPGDFHDRVQVESGVVIERRFERAIPALNALDEVAQKTRLWVLDATLAIAKGTTESAVDCVPNRLLLGLDPVAIDVRARQIRDEQRGALGADPETISEGWIKGAERAGLGSVVPKVKTIT